MRSAQQLHARKKTLFNSGESGTHKVSAQILFGHDVGKVCQEEIQRKQKYRWGGQSERKFNPKPWYNL